MSRDRKFFLLVFLTVLLAGGMLAGAVGSSVHAAAWKNPLQQVVPTDTPTGSPSLSATQTNTLATEGTPSDTPTFTLTPSITLTPTLSLTSSSTASPSATLTPSPTSSGTPPTATPTAPGHIVISEFRTIGPLGAEDEFVEIYNPTGLSVNIGGWLIKKSSGCGTSVQVLVTITTGVILQPGQHYLVAAYVAYSSLANADQRFSPGIANNGGLAVVTSGGLVIDQVGMCAGTYYHEGNFLPPLPVAVLPGTPTPEPGTTNQSYERKPGGNTACYDTGDNARDFNLISPATPLSQANTAVLCSGVSLTTPTPSLTPTITLTRTPTTPPTAIPAAAVLNEFLPHPQVDWNGDGTANVGDEYIELINVSPSALNMKGWKLDTGVNSLTTFTLPDLTLQPRQITTFFGSQTGLSLSDGGGTVRLLKPDGRIVDAFTYPLVELPERTWCRLPDGSDRWGFACRPTPGKPNVSVAIPSLGSGSLAGGSSNCPQGNTAPQALVLAECGGFGAGITGYSKGGVFWLQDNRKWPVFLE
jgi:hypothetical protein